MEARASPHENAARLAAVLRVIFVPDEQARITTDSRCVRDFSLGAARRDPGGKYRRATRSVAPADANAKCHRGGARRRSCILGNAGEMEPLDLFRCLHRNYRFRRCKPRVFSDVRRSPEALARRRRDDRIAAAACQLRKRRRSRRVVETRAERRARPRAPRVVMAGAFRGCLGA